MKLPESQQWSATLRAETQRALEEKQIATPEGRLYFKNLNGQKSFLEAKNLLKNHLALQNSIDSSISCFRSANHLIDAGWVLD